VVRTDVWTTGDDYGWLSNTGLGRMDRGTATASPVELWRDSHYSTSDKTFRVKVDDTAALHDVRIFVGDQFYSTGAITVIHEDGVTSSAPVTTSAADRYKTTTLLGIEDINNDGYIDLRIHTTGSAFSYWFLAGLDIALSSDGLPALPLAVEGGAVAGAAAGQLSAAQLAPIVQEAIDRWESTGLAAEQVAALESVQVTIADLDAYDQLGLAGDRQIVIDDNGAGYGWFVDSTPSADEEFQLALAERALAASDASVADKIDLLTVVMHELGHVLGYEDLAPAAVKYDLMTGSLGAGVRRLPENAAPAVFSDEMELVGAASASDSGSFAAGEQASRDSVFARFDESSLAWQFHELARRREEKRSDNDADSNLDLWWAMYGQQ